MVVDNTGVLLEDYLSSAFLAEVWLGETTLASIRVERRIRRGARGRKPALVIGECGYDSDPLRQRLAQRGRELITRATGIGDALRSKVAARSRATNSADRRAHHQLAGQLPPWWCATTAC